MNLSAFKAVLAAHPDKPMRFVLPDEKSIPPSYHITEIGHVQKNFMDCGGTIRNVSSCLLQAWVATNDESHRLTAGKLSVIFGMADKLLPDADIPVELEYDSPIISQFSVDRSEVIADGIVFHLKSKHTDCLAKESCGLEGGSCSSDNDDCCGSTESVTTSKSKSSCC